MHAIGNGDHATFLKIVLKHQLLSPERAQQLIESARALDRAPSELALEEGLLSDEQARYISQAIYASRVAHLDQLYGRAVQARGLVSNELLLRAYRIQQDRAFQVRLGELLVNAGLLSMEDHTALLREVLRLMGQAEAAPPREPAEARNGESPAILSSQREGAPIDNGQGRAKTTNIIDDFRGADSVVAPGPRALDEDAPIFSDVAEGSSEVNPLIQSAIAMREADDQVLEESVQRERAMLAADMRQAENLTASGNTRFSALDRLELSRGSGDLFEPAKYFAHRRRSGIARRLGWIFIVVGGFAVSALIALVAVNRGAFARSRARIAAIDRYGEDLAALEAYRRVAVQVDKLVPMGLTRREIRGLELQLRERLLRAEVRVKLADNRDEEARRLLAEARAERQAARLEGWSPELAGPSLKLIASLEREAERRRAERWAELFEGSFEYAAAVAAHRLAALSGGTAHTDRIPALRAELEAKLAILGRGLGAASEPGEAEAYLTAYKEYFELFAADHRGQASLVNGRRRRLIKAGLDALGEQQSPKALSYFFAARAMRQDAEVDRLIKLARNGLRIRELLKLGEELEEKGDDRRALAVYDAAAGIQTEQSALTRELQTRRKRVLRSLKGR